MIKPSQKAFTERMTRWNFMGAIGTCGMFLKGTARLEDNKYTTPEIRFQYRKACDEVEKLSLLIKDRFK